MWLFVALRRSATLPITRGPARSRHGERALSSFLLAVVAIGMLAPSTRSHAQIEPEPSETELLEIARRAPPAPEPALDAPGGQIDDDVARRLASSLTRYGRGLEPPGSAAGDPAASSPLLASVRELGFPRAAASEATAAVPVYDTMQPPWNMVAKLLVRFVVDGKPYYYGCSGVLIGPFHLATAAHCIFSWDPNGDGRKDDAAWADDVWVWPAQTDLLPPIGVPERPYGESRSVLNRTYEGWTQAGDITWDLALVTLNRRASDLAGWMGLDIDYPVTSLSFSGYPTEQPYVPPETVLQYAGIGHDNVEKYGAKQVYLRIYSYGGQSGGPVWRSDDADGGYHLQAVLSVSDRRGGAAAALITAASSEDFLTWMASDAADRVPVPRPDLCEYVLAPDAKGLAAESVRQGDTVSVTFNVYNSGTADSGRIAVDFYLSLNPTVATTDLFIDRRQLDNLGPDTFQIATTDLTIPRDAQIGTYYLGWLMRAEETEYSTANNSALIGDHRLRIEVAPTPTATASPEPTLTATAPITPTASITPTAPAASACLGDCRGDLRVTVDEIVLLVSIGLGMESVEVCPSGDANGDGRVTISEVIASVRHALDGCDDRGQDDGD
jgi:V8-like Glu-specific endopeptidase